MFDDLNTMLTNAGEAAEKAVEDAFAKQVLLPLIERIKALPTNEDKMSAVAQMVALLQNRTDNVRALGGSTGTDSTSNSELLTRLGTLASSLGQPNVDEFLTKLAELFQPLATIVDSDERKARSIAAAEVLKGTIPVAADGTPVSAQKLQALEAKVQPLFGPLERLEDGEGRRRMRAMKFVADGGDIPDVSAIQAELAAARTELAAAKALAKKLVNPSNWKSPLTSHAVTLSTPLTAAEQAIIA